MTNVDSDVANVYFWNHRTPAQSGEETAQELVVCDREASYAIEL
jgi:hypothetical protein